MCKALQPDIIIVATKPQYVELALADFTMVSNQGKGVANTLVVSIAAGKSTENVIQALNNNDTRNLRGARVIRVMPNTPCMVGEAASALCRGMKVLWSSQMSLGLLFQCDSSMYAWM
jgi:pyrroline-5-carboxylate reductase